MHNGEASVALSDTSARARAKQIALVRAMPPEQRLDLAMSLSQTTRELTLEGLRRRHPSATERELLTLLTLMLYGKKAAERFSRGRG